MDQVSSGLFLPQDFKRKYSPAFEAVIQAQSQNSFTEFRRSGWHWITQKRCKTTKSLKLAGKNYLSSGGKKELLNISSAIYPKRHIKCGFLGFFKPTSVYFLQSWQLHKLVSVRGSDAPGAVFGVCCFTFLMQLFHQHLPPAQKWGLTSTWISLTQFNFPLGSQVKWTNKKGDKRRNFACSDTGDFLEGLYLPCRSKSSCIHYYFGKQ